MPRPFRGRKIGYRHEVDFYKPAGVRLSGLTVTEIKIDEMEAIRLVDMDGCNQKEAAQKMNVSQSTIARLLETGRRKIATALVQGQAIAIRPGSAPLEYYRHKRDE